MSIMIGFKKRILGMQINRCELKLAKLNDQYYYYDKEIVNKIKEGISEVELIRMQLIRRHIHQKKMIMIHKKRILEQQLRGL